MKMRLLVLALTVSLLSPMVSSAGRGANDDRALVLHTAAEAEALAKVPGWAAEFVFPQYLVSEGYMLDLIRAGQSGERAAADREDEGKIAAAECELQVGAAYDASGSAIMKMSEAYQNQINDRHPTWQVVLGVVSGIVGGALLGGLAVAWGLDAI